MTGPDNQQLLIAITHLDSLLNSVLSGAPETHPTNKSWQLIKSTLLAQFGQLAPTSSAEQTLSHAAASRDFRQLLAIIEGEQTTLGTSASPDATKAKQAALNLRQEFDALTDALQEIRDQLVR